MYGKRILHRRPAPANIIVSDMPMSNINRPILSLGQIPIRPRGIFVCGYRSGVKGSKTPLLEERGPSRVSFDSPFIETKLKVYCGF